MASQAMLCPEHHNNSWSAPGGHFTWLQKSQEGTWEITYANFWPLHPLFKRYFRWKHTVQGRLKSSYSDGESGGLLLPRGCLPPLPPKKNLEGDLRSSHWLADLFGAQLTVKTHLTKWLSVGALTHTHTHVSLRQNLDEIICILPTCDHL